jgi:protein TonB
VDNGDANGLLDGVPGGHPGGIPHGDPNGVPGGLPNGVLASLGELPGNDEPIRLVGDVRPPELLVRINPDYPELARTSKVEGKVILEIVVGRSGEVEEVKVLRSHPLFDAAATEAVRRWKYAPALQSGRPVKVYITVVVDFRLK